MVHQVGRVNQVTRVFLGETAQMVHLEKMVILEEKDSRA
jgi:hypothetical protein